jgi:hypothetical protein
VVSSAAQIKDSMGLERKLPEGLTLEDGLLDLRWHKQKFRLRHSYHYTVISPDESISLGARYIYSGERSEFDAKGFW